MRGVGGSAARARSAGSACGARAVSELKIRIGSCGVGVRMLVPAQPALAATTATERMAQSWLMATEQSRRGDSDWPNLSSLR